MWWCGDYHCDCTQPVVERITYEPGRAPRTERLWEGTFCSLDTERDPEKQERELAEAAARFGVEVAR
jgi:hypothetical protein